MSTPPTQTLVKLPDHPYVNLPADATAVAQPLPHLGPKLLFLVTIFDAGMNQLGCGASDTVASFAVDDVRNREIKDRNWNLFGARDAADARMRR
jgi:hypothetical protein